MNAIHESMRRDYRTVEEIIVENHWPAYPVVVIKGLTRLIQGAPQTVDNGGSAQYTVRYFDIDRIRPGLPEDVAAFLDEIKTDGVRVQLGNTGSKARNLTIQAGHCRQTGSDEQKGGDRADNRHERRRNIEHEHCVAATAHPENNDQ